jgi:hypothetical protein
MGRRVLATTAFHQRRLENLKGKLNVPWRPMLPYPKIPTLFPTRSLTFIPSLVFQVFSFCKSYNLGKLWLCTRFIMMTHSAICGPWIPLAEHSGILESV